MTNQSRRQFGKYSSLQSGFTLVELVTVIIILGILAVGISSFIVFGTQIFVQANAVEKMLGQSRFAIERMSRDIRSAVPNSLRLTQSGNLWQCLELLPISASSTYTSLPVYPNPASATATAIATSQAVAAGQNMLVYPLTAADVYGDPAATTGKIFALAGSEVVGDDQTLRFGNDVQFSENSPRQRFYIASQPISYCFIREPGSSTLELRRYANYGIQIEQPQPSDGLNAGVLMAENIANDLVVQPPLTVNPANLIDNALVLLTPEFSVAGESFRYEQQVQVINAP
ncbi:PilW family protein [Shewanella sp. NIFS-20-20]|uniref:PilW family protein n=1 Tax=Shewanella sp. NIFS-20-20 TaxID=2853806 RepID=UPI001C480701|nr:type II secretion system protein [Shewanella sp. NIFS-20-20]MBV7317389.1 type II secretion system GspH family protein [Shewanella sp. NIFS-20-20]